LTSNNSYSHNKNNISDGNVLCFDIIGNLYKLRMMAFTALSYHSNYVPSRVYSVSKTNFKFLIGVVTIIEK